MHLLQYKQMNLAPKKWAYWNTTFLVISIVLFFIVAETPLVQAAIRHLSPYGYLGAFVSGIFFVSTFTVVPAYYVLLQLAGELNPLILALVAGIGGVVGDLVLFRFLRGGVFGELAPLTRRVRQAPLFSVFRTSYFAWLTPVLGAAIIASPFPDELGIGMVGLSRISQWQFALLALILNIFGILAVVHLVGA